MANTTFIAWAEGDRTVGDGTFNAKIEMDHVESDVDWARDHLRATLSHLWDVGVSRVQILTQAEFDAYTKAEAES